MCVFLKKKMAVTFCDIQNYLRKCRKTGPYIVKWVPDLLCASHTMVWALVTRIYRVSHWVYEMKPKYVKKTHLPALSWIFIVMVRLCRPCVGQRARSRLSWRLSPFIQLFLDLIKVLWPCISRSLVCEGLFIVIFKEKIVCHDLLHPKLPLKMSEKGRSKMSINC